MACTVTPQQVYNALTAAGFSTNQAIGAMANGIAESGLNPETRVVDSNGYYSDGIWQFNEESYPGAAALVTGNCANDLTAQVGFLKSVVSGQALNGSTPAQVAGNFAQYFERCQTCQPGGTSYNQRVADAADVAQWASSGNWPTSAGSLSSSSSSGSGSSSSSSTCLLNIPVVGCALTKSEARALIGGGLLVLSAFAGLVGLLVLAAAGFRASGAGRAAGGALEGAGAAIAFVPGAEVAGLAVGAAGARTRQAASGGAARRSLDQRRQRRTGEARAAQGRQSAAEREARRERGTETITERRPLGGEMGGTQTRTVRRPARAEPARGRHAA